MAPFDDIVRFTQDRRFVTPIFSSPLILPHISFRLLHFLPPLFIIEGTWAEVCALSDQKHENAGEPRLRPAETMKANTGNAKLPGIKERKSGHCELQRTVWKSTVDIQFGQTQKKKGGEEKEERNERAFSQTTSGVRARAVSDIAKNHRLRNRYRQSQTLPSYAGFFWMSDKRNGDRNRLRPEIISSLLSLTSRQPFS